MRIRPSIETDFLQETRDEVDELWAGTATSKGDGGLAEAELSLVDTGSFDDWLTVKGMVSRWQDRVDDALFELAQRLSLLTGRRVDDAGFPGTHGDWGTNRRIGS